MSENWQRQYFNFSTLDLNTEPAVPAVDTPFAITITGCADRRAAENALAAVWGYIEHPEYPQHTHVGKSTGGSARIGESYFWVWRTGTGWSVEKTQ